VPPDGFEFRVLGALDVLRGGQRIALGADERMVLALLLVEADRVVTPAWLGERLWAGLPPADATAAVRRSLSVLRAALHPVLAEEAGGYVLRPGDGLDSRLVEQLIASARVALRAGDPHAALAVLDHALARWRGASLADVAGEPWARAEADRLDELRRVAAEDRATAAHSRRQEPAPAPPSEQVLIGRAAELAALTDALGEAQAGRSAMVLVEAVAGTGKTRLGEELARLAVRRGFLALWARAGAGAGAPALQAWTELLGTLHKVRPDAVTPEVSASPDELAGRLRAVAGSEPLLLLFDDLQWVDCPSVRLLRAVAERLDDARVLIWVAGRPGSPPAGLSGVRRIPLGPLGTDEVARLLAAVGGRPVPDRLARAVARRCHGNAFLVTVAARLLLAESSTVDDIPAGPQAVLGEILDRLDPDQRSTVDAAAGLGRHLDEAVVAAVLDRPLARVRATLDRLVRDGILRRGVSGPRHSFVHDLIWETAYTRLRPAQRAALHGRIADAMIPIARTDQDRVFEVAAHLARAGVGRDEEARAWSARTGEPAGALLGGAVRHVSGG
jgi:hypothetical protein